MRGLKGDNNRAGDEGATMGNGEQSEERQNNGWERTQGKSSKRNGNGEFTVKSQE